MKMAPKTIISVAVTGNHTTLEQHPELPCTPEQIAKAAIDSAKAGAAIAHIHVRYPDGRPSLELMHYREVVDRIRDSARGALINLTSGPGQRFGPGDDDPRVAGPGTTLIHPLQRVEHVVEPKPEIYSLDMNTMWWGTSAVINPPQSVATMAIVDAGTKPELEIFDSGDIHLARQLIDDGTLPSLAYFQIVCGVRFGLSATPSTLQYALSLLPPGAVYAAFGGGRMAFPFVAQSYLLGGHVRVGLEDAVMIRPGEPAPDNVAMVAKAVRILDELGREIATPAEAREILGIA
jgi:uncharacterized protein (DUF849 family)